MIALYLQVLAVLALIAGAAVALGNETRLWIDDRHEDASFERVGRHREVDEMCALVERLRPVLRRAHDTTRLFAEADEALASAALAELTDGKTEWIERPIA